MRREERRGTGGGSWPRCGSGAAPAPLAGVAVGAAARASPPLSAVSVEIHGIQFKPIVRP